ncbi:MAG: hypothetical protein C4334_05090 [Pyrinomonas sp.]|uniref:DNA polymerase III subunit gamma/tau n=1 Tax=Pyrinomonas sp. TaxID=2080306 RepID=UPI00332D59D1
MSYQSIARKWRPQTFDDVVGQEAITRTLQNAIAHERIHHAYLFAGPRGTGKTTTARLFAKALNCQRSDGPTTKPCATLDQACASCREVAESRSIDVLEIDAASNTGVDNVREAIINTVAVAPARDRYKVFIIDEVHMLSGAAFNALLKTLEEPPPRVVFIMATTEKQKVPATILSRCQDFTFRHISLAKMVERLRLIAAAEGIEADAGALVEIARAGQGSMRDALSAFDQVLSYWSEGKLTPEAVRFALGITGKDVLTRTVRGIAAGDVAELFAVVEELVSRGTDLRSFCRELLGHLRDLLVVRVAGADATIIERLPEERLELEKEAALFSESDLVRFFHSLTETERLLRESAHPRYQLEIGLVKLVEMGRVAQLAQVIERLEKLEAKLRQGVVSSMGGASATSDAKSGVGTSHERPVESHSATRSSIALARDATGSSVASRPATLRLVADNTTAEEPPKTESTTKDNPSPSAQDLTAELKRALEARARPLLVVAIEGASRVQFQGNDLCFEFTAENKHLRDVIMRADHVRLLREVCHELTGREMGVRIAVAGGVSPKDERERERERLREWAESHPTVKNVLRKFRGEIIDVRPIDEKEH